MANVINRTGSAQSRYVGPEEYRQLTQRVKGLDLSTCDGKTRKYVEKHLKNLSLLQGNHAIEELRPHYGRFLQYVQTQDATDFPIVKGTCQEAEDQKVLNDLHGRLNLGFRERIRLIWSRFFLPKGLSKDFVTRDFIGNFVRELFQNLQIMLAELDLNKPYQRVLSNKNEEILLLEESTISSTASSQSSDSKPSGKHDALRLRTIQNYKSTLVAY